MIGLRGLKPVMWIVGNWQIALAVAGAFALWSTGIYFVGRDHGYEARVAQTAKAREAAERLEDESAGVAAGARETDAAKIEQGEGERNAAIIGAGEAGAKPSAARNALNCERMRKAGRDVRDIPACGGREGGAKAGPIP